MGNQIVQKESGALAAPNLTESLAEETARRQQITLFIRENLKEGVDYGTIANFPKPTLLKPGAEKFCSLLHLRAKFHKDEDTLSMLPQAIRDAGAIALLCELHGKDDQVVSEGRGVCTVAEKKGQVNTAVKIAEKRALMDAVLRAFSISDSFTQDLDEPEQPTIIDAAPVAVSPEELKDLETESREIIKELGWTTAKFNQYALNIGKKPYKEMQPAGKAIVLRKLAKLYASIKSEQKPNPGPVRSPAGRANG